MVLKEGNNYYLLYLRKKEIEGPNLNFKILDTIMRLVKIPLNTEPLNGIFSRVAPATAKSVHT